MKRVEKPNSHSYKIDTMNERKTPEDYARKWDLLPEYNDEGFRGGNESKRTLPSTLKISRLFMAGVCLALILRENIRNIGWIKSIGVNWIWFNLELSIGQAKEE